MNLYNPQYPKAREMPRSFDVTFYRILWVTLVALGLTFTVILTSVFVDIDELLAKRAPVIQNAPQPEPIKPKTPSFEEFQDFQPNDSDEMDASYRTKRSLESSNLLFHISSPKMKKIITNRLATLLEELDEESNPNTEVTNKKEKNLDKLFLSSEDLQKREETRVYKETDKLRREMNNKDIFHLAMHNILLQGIIGHMDLNDVYNKAHLLIKSFDNPDNTAKETKKLFEDKPKELMKVITQDSFNEQDKFLDELLKCQKLQDEVSQTKVKDADKNETINEPPILIKTVIEITNKMMNEKKINSDKHIKGLVKLVYNGKPIELRDIKENMNVATKTENKMKEKQHSLEHLELTEDKSNTLNKIDKGTDLNRAIADYIKTHAIKLQNNNLLTKESLETKRLKRQIKIHYLNDGFTTEKSKLKEKLKKHEEELFVEIETHFDGKGKKGEKKKKLVRSLIDKIQKAINSNIQELQQDNKVEKEVQIKKRSQNPIHHKEIQTIVINTPTVKPVEHRHLHPISKTANVMQPLTSVLDKHGDNWKRMYNGPGFLTVSKSLNSAEMSEVDVDYSSVMKNGIPKRLQKPLNTESEDVKPHEFSNMGNVTLFLKEIGGSGFSIGINQYTDAPPDKDSLKMFTGLESLIQAYHDQYDQTDREALSNSEDISYTDNNYETVRTDRRKRGLLNVKLFSNLKTKTKLNRFLNTNAMQTKKIFLKSKRNKRHIDKIRIVASDHYPRSKEVVLVSHEDIFADRAVIKEEEPPEVEIGDREEERYDFIAPYQNSYSKVPHFQPYLGSVYDTQSLHTGLMSKYPHVFVENISKSKEIINIHPINNENEDPEVMKPHDYRKFDTESRLPVYDKSIESNISAPNIDEIVNAILPQNNYKLTVKILPKNTTNMGPGYKEVHTSINKSFDKNGIRYVSSVNVSEISKFESVNKTKEHIRTAKIPQNVKHDEQHENEIKLLLKLHKMRIDNQLEHLKTESQKLKQMIGKDDTENWIKNISNIIDVFKHLGLKVLDEKVTLAKSNNNHTLIQKNVEQKSTTVKPFIENRQEDTEKSNLINIIKENGNTTREILQKIDKNTDILQSFLRKISDKLSRESKIVTEAPNYLRVDPINPFIEHLHQNYTNSIPFIYAFQKPIQNSEKSFKNTASVIYHGHLHTNGLENGGRNDNYPKDVTNNVKTQNIVHSLKDLSHKLSNNETRFFIDELENDFKVAPNVNSHLLNIKINTTSV